MKKIIQFSAFLAFLTLFSANVFAVDYDLWVVGIQVTDANKSDIVSSSITAGRVSYDPESNTLTLNGATMSASQQKGIDNQIPGLTIDLVGTNSINSDDIGINSYNADLIITGSGSLYSHGNLAGIYFDNCNLKIANTTVTAEGFNTGISGNTGDNETLTIGFSVVKAKGTESGTIDGSIVNIKDLIFFNSHFSQPSGAVFDASRHAVCANNSIVKTEIVINSENPFKIWISGTQINVNNKNSVGLPSSNATLSRGNISYDPGNNILTFNGTSINHATHGVEILESQVDNLIVNLVGENIWISHTDAVYFDAPNTTITGNGRLTLSTSNNASAIGHNQGTLTIDNTVVTLIGGRGYCGNGYGAPNDNTALIVNNSIVRVTGEANGSIVDCNSLTLNDCEITQPVGAVYSPAQKAICLDGEIVKTEVIIAPIEVVIDPIIDPITTGVKETIADNVKIRMQNRQLTIENSDRQAIAVYNVMGQVIVTKQNPNNTETFSLPTAGVYIVKVGKSTTKVVAQ